MGKFYCMKLNFLYEITAASRTLDLWATAPISPFSLSATEFVETPPPIKIPGYTTACIPWMNSTTSQIFTAKLSHEATQFPLQYIQLYCGSNSEQAYELQRIFGRVRKIAKSDFLLRHASVRPSAWNTSVPTGRIFIKFDIWLLFLKKIVEKIQVSLKSDRNKGTLHKGYLT